MSDQIDPGSGEYIGEETADRPPAFDPYRIAVTAPARKLVADIEAGALNTEQHFGLRQRKRRPKDARIFREIVEAIVADIAYQTLRGHRTVRITRSKRRLGRKSRYEPDILSNQLPAVLDLMEKRMGILSQQIGNKTLFQSLQTEVAAGAWLRNRMAGLTADDFGRREGAEVVMMKGEDRTERVEYVDTEQTEQIRSRVRVINDALRTADIECLMPADAAMLIDPRSRDLRRIFTRDSWHSGGRLFGGFWQPMRKRDRSACILIGGESVEHLDYRNMAAALAYARVGKSLPAGDCYAVSIVGPNGHPKAIPRDTVKRLMSAVFFVHHRPTRWPRGIASHGIPIGDALTALEAAHPDIAPLFYRGIGHELQHDESEVLVSALLALIAEGITALPVHDCLIVAESDAPAARELMALAFEQRMGAAVHVTTDTHESEDVCL